MFRPSNRSDLLKIKEIWQEAFGDSDRFLSMYFEEYYVPEELWVCEIEGEIVSICTLYSNAGLTFADGSRLPCPCIYALATAKKAQGNGYAIQLARAMMEDAKNRGTKHFLIMPADDGLRAYYAQAYGFRDFGIAPKVSVKEVLELEMQACSPEDYNRYREGFLQGICHISFTDKQIRLVEESFLLSKEYAAGRESHAGLYCRLNALGNALAIAAIEETTEGPIVKEYLYTGWKLPSEGCVTAQLIGNADAVGYAGFLFD